MKPGILSKSCLSFLLMLMLLLSALVQAITAQDNETETAAQAINARTIEIVFLHESSQIEFSSAVDAIMEQLKFTDIEINYRKVQHNSGTMPDEVCEMGASGLSMLIDATPSGSIAIRNTLEVHRIPYFNFDYTIQSLVKLMEFYLAQRQAVDAVFVFNDEIASSEAFHHFVRASSLRVMIHDSSTFERLKTFRPVPDFTVLIAATDSVERLFRNADDAGLVRRSPDSWSVMFTDFTGETFKHAEYPEMSRLLPHQNVCCNPNCICSSHVTLKFEALSSFLHQMVPVFEANGFPIRRFECSDERDVTTTTLDSAEQLLNDLSRMIETNDLIYVDDELKIWQNLRFDVRRSLNGSSSIETIATVDRNGLKAVGVPVIGKTRRFFRIGVTESLPYTYYKRDPLTDKILVDEHRKPIYEGYCMDLITQLSRKLNFDYELVEPTSGKFGERQSNGKFDGLVGDMVRGDLDVIVGALKMTAEREEVIDFVVPYFDQSGILIVMKKPIPDTSLFKFMSVLRLEVWLSILGALSITAIVIWILEVFSPYSARNWNYAEPCRNFTLRESFWFSLTSFTPQGGGEAPKALSGRVIVAAYWLFVVLMLATFTANLAAFLTVERMQSPVQSLDQLARQSRINYTVVKGSDTHQYFQNMRNAEDKLYELWKNLTLSTTSDDVQYRIWDYPVKEQYASILMSIEATRTLPNASEGFRIVNERETNDFAFIHDAQEIKYEISRNCNYSAVGEVFAEQSYAIAVQQGSELQDEFSRAILELQKERFFEELTSRYWNSSFTASCINSDDSEGITLESLGGVFIATLVGLVVAMVVLVGEVYYYKRKSKKENDRKQLAVFTTTRIQPLDKFDYADKVIKGGLLLGSGNFIPVNKKPRLSFVSVQPRD